ncbi:MAG: MFS transporter [Microbacteriaceae bacterium]
MDSRRAWIVFAAGLFAYIAAVLQRSSLGVAGVVATERFGIQAVALSTLAVSQIAVYAALQVPVGVVLDRLGPRRLIVTGSIVLGLGQLAVALAPAIGPAVAGRMLVGAGDALIFISAQRLVIAWFAGRRVPLMSQLLGATGALGQLLSAVPFSSLLHAAGWTPAFVSAAALSLLAGVVAAAVIADRPPGAAAPVPGGLRESLGRLREALARPGTQLGFWSHFVTQSSGTVFALLWGAPFLSIGMGLGGEAASLLLAVIVVVGVLSGPVLGLVIARHPLRRSTVVLAIVAAMGMAWALVLAWPGRPPLWPVVLLIVVIAVGGPGSLIGFDFARTFNPQRSIGSATGIVNVGGFLASFLMMFLIGLVLDAVDAARGGDGSPTLLYSFDSFRIAFLVQYLVVGAGTVMLVRARRRTRARLHAEEGITVAPVWVALARAWNRRLGRR